MTALILLLACGSPADAPSGEAAPSTPEPATPPGTTPPQTTPDTRVVDTDGPVKVLDRAERDEVRPALSGYATLCDPEQAGDPDAVWLAAEFVGAPDALTVTPWVDGQPGDPVALAVDAPGDLFRTTEATDRIDGCAEATWVWRLDSAHADYDLCVITGPATDTVLDELVDEGCVRG